MGTEEETAIRAEDEVATSEWVRTHLSAEDQNRVRYIRYRGCRVSGQYTGGLVWVGAARGEIARGYVTKGEILAGLRVVAEAVKMKSIGEIGGDGVRDDSLFERYWRFDPRETTLLDIFRERHPWGDWRRLGGEGLPTISTPLRGEGALRVRLGVKGKVRTDLILYGEEEKGDVRIKLVLTEDGGAEEAADALIEKVTELLVERRGEVQLCELVMETAKGHIQEGNDDCDI